VLSEFELNEAMTSAETGKLGTEITMNQELLGTRKEAVLPYLLVMCRLPPGEIRKTESISQNSR
jgi:hypothetical protein